MRRFRSQLALFLLICAFAVLANNFSFAQSPTTGDVLGVVRDPSGAVLAGVPVALQNDEKGFAQSTVTNAQGAYRFPLLQPGSYTVSTSAQGFQGLHRQITVQVGQTAVADLALTVSGTETTVHVTAEGALLQPESAEVATSYNARQIASLPNPGNDLTHAVQTAPGAVMNTESGWGKFSTFGLPATSNLFTLDGMHANDPFQNVNNSGAANLLLGNNEVQEATVISNGYSGQWGGFAGANVNYITRSGSNAWHGNAAYWWNGRSLNANSWFNKNAQAGQAVTPRAFDNANQYAASVGGPIVKNKAFFFFNYEGLRVVLPTSAETLVPSSQFEQATMENLAASGLDQSLPFYQTMFDLYNHAPGLSRAVAGVPDAADASGCGGFTFTSSAGTLGAGGLPCAREFRSTNGNFTHEFLASGRFDFILGQNDRMFVRLQENKGLQASYTDPISPLFNAQSNQPEYQAHISESHVFSARAVNNLVFASQYYSAVFQQPDPAAALAAFPTTMLLGDFTFDGIGGGASTGDYFWPQGRNVTSYQLLDDVTYALSAKHNLKFGASFHRNLISDHDYGFFSSGLAVPFTLADFYAGGVGPFGDELVQYFPSSLNQPIRTYQLGWYVQDEWRAKSNLHLTFALRFDHASNPECGHNCFARLASPFQDLNHDPNVPYNQAIVSGLSQALPSFSAVVVQPRLGFAWQPMGLRNTVVRGGIGIFMDSFPGTIADSMSSNSPVLNPFVILGLNGVPGWNYAISPDQAANGVVNGNLFNVAANSNTSFLSAFNSGGTYGSISASNPFFFSPSINNASHVVAPTYQEWNLQVQQGVGNNTSFSANYVGNHGVHEAVQFNGLNAYCPPSVCPFGFSGMPAAPVDPRFGVVNEVRSAAVSNYNGLTFGAQHRFSHGLQLQAHYTWSHALDEISNGGFLQFNFGTNASLLNPVNNFDLRQYNYGNADYDTRHAFSANYIWQVPKGPTPFLKGWQVAGTVFTRAGLPYTVVDTATSSQLGGLNYGAGTYANFLGGAIAGCSNPKQPCLDAAQFSSPIALAQTGPGGFGAQRRNQFYGPGFFNTDMSLVKNTKIPGWERGEFGLGVQFYNLLNHPNFDQPVNDINDSRFGQITRTVSGPTSILGSGLGGDSSPRMIQLTGRISF